MEKLYIKKTDKETGEVSYKNNFQFRVPTQCLKRCCVVKPEKYYKWDFNDNGEYVKTEIDYDQEIDKYKDIELTNLLKNNIEPAMVSGSYVDNREFQNSGILDAINEKNANQKLELEINELENEKDKILKEKENLEKQEYEKLKEKNTDKGEK